MLAHTLPEAGFLVKFESLIKSSASTRLDKLGGVIGNLQSFVRNLEVVFSPRNVESNQDSQQLETCNLRLKYGFSLYMRSTLVCSNEQNTKRDVIIPEVETVGPLGW